MARWPAHWPPFLWGASTSSHQVEGNQSNDWTEWENSGHVAEPSGRAADSWNRWPEDLELAKKLGLNSYRFSLEWSRIEPKPGIFDREALQRYRAMIVRMREIGLIPLMTLHHFTLPLWVSTRGGFLNSQASRWFSRYVRIVVEEVGDLVDLFITINEPMVLVVMGYLIAAWPPGGRGFGRALKLIRRLVSIHADAYHTIKRIKPNAWVGLAHHLIQFEPWRPGLLDYANTRLLHYLMNDRLVRMVGEYQDFIGLNYYTRQYAHWTSGLHPIQNRPGVNLSDLGWEIYPHGLTAVLKRVQSFHKPVLVTENGIATRDEALRTRYLEQHLAAVSAAQKAGIDVRGYFHWSLLDNFEWAEGYGPRFGLVEVNYDTLARSIRPAGYRYRDIIQANENTFPVSVPPASTPPAAHP